MYGFRLGVKRLFDIVVSSCGLIILFPVFIVMAILIKSSSRGPLFFIQERLGKGGVPFRIIKFRTMVVNAENFGGGVCVCNENDPRITSIGRILRSTSLDELPQLINVFKGDMSLVGPRPPVSYHPYDGYANYPKWAKKRFEMRPGITGLTQVTARNSVGWDERIRIDLYYIKNFSIWMDAKILLLTMRKVILQENIYT